MRVLRELARLEGEGGRVAVVTVVQTRGSTPGESGARMLVYPDGRTLGSIGGGCMENALRTQALEALATMRPRLVEHTLDDEVDETGMICGGTLRVFIDPVELGG